MNTFEETKLRTVFSAMNPFTPKSVYHKKRDSHNSIIGASIPSGKKTRVLVKTAKFHPLDASAEEETWLVMQTRHKGRVPNVSAFYSPVKSYSTYKKTMGWYSIATFALGFLVLGMWTTNVILGISCAVGFVLMSMCWRYLESTLKYKPSLQWGNKTGFNLEPQEQYSMGLDPFTYKIAKVPYTVELNELEKDKFLNMARTLEIRGSMMSVPDEDPFSLYSKELENLNADLHDESDAIKQDIIDKKAYDRDQIRKERMTS